MRQPRFQYLFDTRGGTWCWSTNGVLQCERDRNCGKAVIITKITTQLLQCRSIRLYRCKRIGIERLGCARNDSKTSSVATKERFKILLPGCSTGDRSA